MELPAQLLRRIWTAINAQKNNNTIFFVVTGDISAANPEGECHLRGLRTTLDFASDGII